MVMTAQMGQQTSSQTSSATAPDSTVADTNQPDPAAL
jgi:hypothetical protein